MSNWNNNPYQQQQGYNPYQQQQQFNPYQQQQQQFNPYQQQQQQFQQPPQLNLESLSWSTITGGLNNVCAQTAHNVWGVNCYHEVFQWNGSSFQKIGGAALETVSVGVDGSVWGISPKQEIFRYNGNHSWTQITGGLNFISVHSANSAWGVNCYNEVFHWNGSSFQKMPGALTNISVGVDGSVWGLGTNKDVHKWDGFGNWIKMPGDAVTWISVHDANHVVCVNTLGDFYAWEAQQQKWVQIQSNQKATCLSIGRDGAEVWGCNVQQNGCIFKSLVQKKFQY